MLDLVFTIAAAIVGIAVVLGTLRFIEMCAAHELRMAEQRSRERQPDSLRGGGDRLGVHEQGYDL